MLGAIGLVGFGSASAGSTTTTAAEPDCVTQTMQGMSPAERIGQLFLVGMNVNEGLSPELTSLIRTFHFGNILFVGNSTSGVERIRQLTDAVQKLAPGAKMFIAANQEGGQIQPLKGPGFAAIPPATVQGTMPPAALEQLAKKWGAELRDAGVNLNLAPVMDVVPAGTEAANAPIGALQRQFGSTTQTVAGHGTAFIRGMQNAGIATTAKHFPGLGRVRGNTDFTADVVDTSTTENDVETFQAAINNKVPFVMIALARYTRIDRAHLAAYSAEIVTGLLRHRMGFTGVVVSDDLGAAATATISPADRAEEFLKAGGDLITEQDPGVAGQMVIAIQARMKTDEGLADQVASGVKSVLTAKAKYGLLSCG